MKVEITLTEISGLPADFDYQPPPPVEVEYVIIHDCCVSWLLICEKAKNKELNSNEGGKQVKQKLEEKLGSDIKHQSKKAPTRQLKATAPILMGHSRSTQGGVLEYRIPL